MERMKTNAHMRWLRQAETGLNGLRQAHTDTYRDTHTGTHTHTQALTHTDTQTGTHRETVRDRQKEIKE